MKKQLAGTLTLILVLLTACGGPMSFQQGNNDPFIQRNYKAADALLASASARNPIQLDEPLLVATIVNVDSLDQSSRMGRIISEQIQARFTQQGYSVVELKLRGKLFVKKDQGELLLSREVQDISAGQKAQAVVVGTYAVAKNAVYINLKMVGNDNIVMSAHDYSLPMGANVQALLQKPCC